MSLGSNSLKSGAPAFGTPEYMKAQQGGGQLARRYGLPYRSSRHRAAALPHWLAYYNERRPHGSLGGLPPISRVHNVCGQDN